MGSTDAADCYRFGRFELRPGERVLLDDGVSIRLGPHAFDLLVALVESSGRLMTKEDLLARVWQRVIVEDNTLQVHISALRKVLGADAIVTVSGSGYRFVPDVVRSRARKHNLPNQLTSFVGREHQIAQIKDLMGTHRLLTLTGAGGCGKTRLALRVAEELVDGFPDGCWIVEFAPLSDPKLVPETVATALAVQERMGQEIAEGVEAWLATRHALLVFDNAEHLLEACAAFADRLLKRCDRLSILTTSRERLGVAGELTYRVPSLSVPSQHNAVPLMASEAARLFLDRARLHRPELNVTGRDEAALASICRRLDGIALAIELAAPRLRSMSMVELGRHLDDRFDVLTGGSRAALPRHRTLRSLIDWSHDLLNDREKTLLRRCAVFAGGCTLEAAEGVCAGEGIERNEVLELLTSLADKSLLVIEVQSQSTRFSMLETVRHYARDRLHESGEESAVCERYVDHFAAAAFALDELRGDEERQRELRRLDAEVDNLRAALAAAEASASTSRRGLRLAARLFWFWRTRGYYSEGRRWIAKFLAVAPGETEDDDHAQAQQAVGTLAMGQTDMSAAEAHCEAALAIRRRIGPRQKVAILLGNLGALALARDESAAKARGLIEESIAIAREIGERRQLAWSLHALGLIACEARDFHGAADLLEESVSIRREFGRWNAADTLADLGKVRYALGDARGARAVLMEALDAEREYGNQHGIAKALTWLGMVLHDEGDVAGASTHLKEALGVQHVLGSMGWLPVTLELLAGLVAESAGPLVAARLWGHAQRLHKETGSPQGALERERSERQIAATRRALQDDAAFDRAWQEGCSLTVDEAVELALGR
jgi:predicted ATPase